MVWNRLFYPGKVVDGKKIKYRLSIGWSWMVLVVFFFPPGGFRDVFLCSNQTAYNNVNPKTVSLVQLVPGSGFLV